jgi:adenosyl cobinamide kinase/adenosyl cobinamide phosphate guanylyltransferase
MIVLVTGGARAGKSTWALARATELADARPRGASAGEATLGFLATAQALDGEMQARVAAHRAERGPRWHTLEEPVAVAGVLPAFARTHGAVVVDCLTLWTTNLTWGTPPRALAPELDALCAALVQVRDEGGHVVVVTNEVGLGLVPFDPDTRRWRDDLGRVNQRVAALADEVVLLVSGLPLRLR